MRLTSAAVARLTWQCLAGKEAEDNILVKGIVGDFAYNPAKIAEHKADILELVQELPEQFQWNVGGGWSFLNMCDDKHGNQWTGLHKDMEWLCCLAIAAGVGQWLLPRDMWSRLPGGMPYVAFGEKPKPKEVKLKAAAP